MTQPTVDVAVLSRDLAPLDPRVERAIRTQVGVAVRFHRVRGTPLESDRNRFVTIARARNEAKAMGCSDWLMFVDDDVVIPRNCILELLNTLARLPAMGALGVYYLSDCPIDDAFRHHVSMGATLFRRAAINSIHFREAPGHCDCQCCCNDLRQRGWGIAYLPGHRAIHLNRSEMRDCSHKCDEEPSTANRVTDSRFIMAAFDYRHCAKFQDRFLRSLRSSGNDEQVIAIAYGLSASDARTLARQERVTLIQPSDRRGHIAADRFFHFRKVISNLPAQSLVAYWDAGDVMFQRPLTEMWHCAETHPTKVLVVAEPWTHLTIGVRARWIATTTSNYYRAQLLRLMRYKPNINGGFAAGTHRSFAVFTEGVCRWIDSPALRGTGSYNQIAMNAHCYESHSYTLVDEGWNYCLAGRPRQETVFTRGEPIRRTRDGQVIPVVHGTAQTLDRVEALEHGSVPIQPH